MCNFPGFPRESRFLPLGNTPPHFPYHGNPEVPISGGAGSHTV